MQYVLANKTLLDQLHRLTKEVISTYRYLYTRKQAAELLGMSKSAVANLVALGRLEEIDGPEGKEAKLITHDSIQKELERRRSEGIRKRGRLSKKDVQYISKTSNP